MLDIVIVRVYSSLQALTNNNQYCKCWDERTGCKAMVEYSVVQLRHWSAEKPAKPDDIFVGNLPLLLGALCCKTVFSMLAKSFLVRISFSIQNCITNLAVPRKRLCIGSTTAICIGSKYGSSKSALYLTP